MSRTPLFLAIIALALMLILFGAAKCEPPNNQGDPLIGCKTGEFSPYYGNFHAHSNFSDGEEMPEDAFAYARDVGRLDIFALTDHLEQFYLPPPVNKWTKMQAAADAANQDGVYVALAGYEYGSAFEPGTEVPFVYSSGHNNVFFDDELMPIVQLDYQEFYKSLIACETCLAQFNHPGEELQQNWDDFAYNAAVDVKMKLFELSGSGDPWPIYFQALDQGWHIGPARNQDNHGPDWGSKDDTRTGMWMTDLSRDAVKNAMHDRRSFATTDKNAMIKMVSADGCWMGSDIGGISATNITITAEDRDSSEGFNRLELYGQGQQLLSSFDCQNANPCVITTEIRLDQSFYFLARAIQSDGGQLVSAPIWLHE